MTVRSTPDRSALAVRYQAGESYATLGREFHMSAEAIRKRLVGMVSPRPPGGRAGMRPRPVLATWEARVVDRLCELKSLGSVDFGYAWQVALRENPSRLRDQARPTGQLFDETGHGDESVVEFFERVCGDAWHGRGSDRLRGFSVSMLAGSFVEMDEVA